MDYYNNLEQPDGQAERIGNINYGEFYIQRRTWSDSQRI